MLTWVFPILLTTSLTGSTFQLQWFEQERASRSQRVPLDHQHQDALYHQHHHHNQHQDSPLRHLPPVFPCDTNSSAPPATSVHQLRPQDVKISYFTKCDLISPPRWGLSRLWATQSLQELERTPSTSSTSSTRCNKHRLVRVLFYQLLQMRTEGFPS